MCATWAVWGLVGRICEICAAGFPANDGVNFSQTTMAWISRKVWREFARIVDYLTSTSSLCVKTTASLPPQCYMVLQATKLLNTFMKAIKLSDTRIKSNYFETLWLTLKITKNNSIFIITITVIIIMIAQDGWKRKGTGSAQINFHQSTQSRSLIITHSWCICR